MKFRIFHSFLKFYFYFLVVCQFVGVYKHRYYYPQRPEEDIRSTAVGTGG